MKKYLLTIFAVMFCLQTANAFIVSVKGYGDVPAEGLDIEITEGAIDPMSGKYTMGIEGELLSDASTVDVSLIRSEEGLSDEFCCGGDCTSGNGLKQDIKSFSVSGLSTWYAHYTPSANSNVTITYHFSEASETREVRVHYIYNTEGCMNAIQDASSNIKEFHDGILYIRCGETVYTINGNKLL